MKNKELKKEFNLMWFGDSKKGKTGILATVLTCDNDGGSARIIMNFIEEQLKAKEKEVLERLIESDWDKPEIKELLEEIVDDLTEKEGETGWCRAFNEKLLKKYKGKL